jgi:hypothetical protein
MHIRKKPYSIFLSRSTCWLVPNTSPFNSVVLIFTVFSKVDVNIARDFKRGCIIKR